MVALTVFFIPGHVTRDISRTTSFMNALVVLLKYNPKPTAAPRRIEPKRMMRSIDFTARF